ncbi:MAG TPA: hypothetical protein VGX16_04960 [Solirubrobacteraceae bacterium]|nr:hypothetical protein [Solirubrobacteraceae bacterium]
MLLAGADPKRRAAVREEMREALAPGTRFEEASLVWEVLQRAPTSEIVVLADDLHDATAESLMLLLGARHPRLPIISLGACAQD